MKSFGLKLKLLSAFSICSLIVGGMLIAAFMSLNDVQVKLIDTTEKVRDSINSQSKSNQFMVDLQTITRQIDKTTDIEKIGSLDKKIEKIRTKYSTDSVSETLDVIKNQLLTNKKGYLQATSDFNTGFNTMMTAKIGRLQAQNKLSKNRKSLSRLKREIEDVIKAMNIATLTIMDDTEFQAGINIENAIEKISLTKLNGNSDSSSSQLDRLYEVAEDNIYLIKTVSEVRSKSLEIDSLIKEVLVSNDADQIRYLKLKLHTLLENIEDEITTIGDNNHISILESSTGKLLVLGDSVIETKISTLDAEERMSKANQMMDYSTQKIADSRGNSLKAGANMAQAINRVNKELATIENIVSESSKKLAKTTQVNMKESQKSVTKWKSILALIGGVAICISISLGYITYKIISNPIKGLTLALQDIAQGEGDLTKRLLSRTNDEIGSMATWFNSFLQKLQSTISEVGINTKKMSLSADSLSSTSEEMLTTSQKTNSKSNDIALSSNQLKSNSEEMAKNAEEISTSISSTTEAIDLMTEAIRSASKACAEESSIASSANEKAHKVHDVMSRLSKAAEEIGTVTEIIGSIAEQTNLLALNATIEAASAGAAGKGFAVVANEVKDLARQSSDAAKQITDQIKNMQISTKDSIQAINEVSSIIEEIDSLSGNVFGIVENQSATVMQLSDSMDNINKSTQSLLGQIRETNKSANDVASNIEEIQESAKASSHGANETNSAAKTLARMSEELNQIVNQFKT